MLTLAFSSLALSFGPVSRRAVLTLPLALPGAALAYQTPVPGAEAALAERALAAARPNPGLGVQQQARRRGPRPCTTARAFI